MRQEQELKKMTKSERIGAIAPPLALWYQRAARPLPWRDHPDAYRVWISEIMLQQTRIEAVIPYYLRFIKELPDVSALAEVSDDRLMKLFEGLGYYTRARNLKKCAQVLVSDYGGTFPASFEELKRLPGIGSYTAGAIASIAFDMPVPAVDGNVMRVIARLTADDRDILKPAFRKEAEEELSVVLKRGKESGDVAPGVFNEAVMELGETICLPNGAAFCEKCPLLSLCLAGCSHTQDLYPVRTPKKPRRIEDRTVFRIRVKDGYLIGKRPQKGLLAGMYEFPGVTGCLSEEEVRALFLALTKEEISLRPLGNAKHIFTHLEWHMTGYEIEQKTPAEQNSADAFVNDLIIQGKKTANWNLIFATKEDLAGRIAMPTAFSAYFPDVAESDSSFVQPSLL